MLKSKKAFSFIEVVLIIIAISIVLLAISPLMTSGVRFFESATSQTRLQEQITLSTEHMTRNINRASSITWDPAVNPAQITLNYAAPGGDTTISYRHDTANNTIIFTDENSNESVIAENITALQFTGQNELAEDSDEYSRTSMQITSTEGQQTPVAINTTARVRAPKIPTVVLAKTFGGSGADHGTDIKKTSDGGYIIVGYTTSFGAGSSDVYLIKIDASGNSTWQRTFGGTGQDVGYCVNQTSDGGYIISGYTTSWGEYEAYLIKTNANGNTVWQKRYGNTTSANYGFDVKQTSDDGYIVVGKSQFHRDSPVFRYQRKVFVMKTDANGNNTWQKWFGTGSYDYATSVQEADDGYIISGMVRPSGMSSSSIYLIKTDINGNTVWQKRYYSSGSVSNDIHKITDGYILAGATTGWRQGFLLETDTDGNSSTGWWMGYGGTGYDQFDSMAKTFDGGYIAAGYTRSFGAQGQDIYFVKTDSSGNSLWQRQFGGSDDDWIEGIQQGNDGGYAMVGVTKSFGSGSKDIILIMTDPSGTCPGIGDITTGTANPVQDIGAATSGGYGPVHDATVPDLISDSPVQDPDTPS